jgi:putative transposase
MEAITNNKSELGIAATCSALGLPRATYYRLLQPQVSPPPRPAPPRALSTEQRRVVLERLHEPRFVDLAPTEVWAQLLDEGEYHCSVRTMYRILEANAEVRERRNQLRHPHYAAPELLATKPNELWSWDITKLLGPAKWTYFHLYVILDVFSRYVVGWMVATRESKALARKLIAETCARQGIAPAQLTLHADRGSSMKSKPVALLLADLGVTRTHSRPHVSNDNPFSEAQFKTLKYRPEFPERFGSVHDARAHSGPFFDWYNNDHHHVGIGLLTPHDVHYGLGEAKRAQRAATLEAAYRAHPERFPHGLPAPPLLPSAVWINKPKKQADTLSSTTPCALTAAASEHPLSDGSAESAQGGDEPRGPGGADPGEAIKRGTTALGTSATTLRTRVLDNATARPATTSRSSTRCAATPVHNAEVAIALQ